MILSFIYSSCSGGIVTSWPSTNPRIVFRSERDDGAAGMGGEGSIRGVLTFFRIARLIPDDS